MSYSFYSINFKCPYSEGIVVKLLTRGLFSLPITVPQIDCFCNRLLENILIMSNQSIKNQWTMSSIHSHLRWWINSDHNGQPWSLPYIIRGKLDRKNKCFLFSLWELWKTINLKVPYNIKVKSFSQNSNGVTPKMLKWPQNVQPASLFREGDDGGGHCLGVLYCMIGLLYVKHWSQCCTETNWAWMV